MSIQPLVAEGKNGDLAFDGSFVEIRRTRSFAVTGFQKGVKRIPIANVTALQWKPASGFQGFVQVVFPGSIEHTHSYDWDRRAKYDENTVTFDLQQSIAMEQVRDAIEAAIAVRARGASALTTSGAAQQTSGQVRDCPYCAESIKAAAVVCRFCGRDVEPVAATNTAHPPADWHPDPFGRWQLRYWDGTRWTEHVSSGGTTSIDPPH